MDWIAIQLALWTWVRNGCGLADDHVMWGQQKAPRPAEPAIVMRISDIEVVGNDWTDVADQHFTIATKTITAVDTAANTLTIVGHGLLSGDGPVRLASSGTLPGGLVAATDYWVVRSTDDKIQLSATYMQSGGNNVANPITVIDLTTAGSGTITLVGTAETLRSGQEIQFLARGFRTLTLSLECYTTVGVGIGMAQAVLQRVAGRVALPSQGDLLAAAGLGLIDLNRVRAINGMVDVVLFEPRARMDIKFSAVSEEVEDGRIIQHVELTDLMNNVTRIVPP